MSTKPWVKEYASGSAADFTGDLAAWVQCCGTGTVVLTNEDGSTFTKHATNGTEVYPGSFSALVSTSCAYIVMGNGVAPPVVGAPAALTSPVRMGASGAQTNATTTMANLADLSVNVVAGQKVSGVLRVFANNSTGAEGIKFDLGGGSATFTSIEFGFVATPGGATVGTKTSTAIGTAITCSAVATTDSVYEIPFAGVVNAGGTLIPRFAENSTSSGTATVQINSTLSIATTAN